MSKKVLIVGGVAGGASAAARLRRLDEHAQIILFERGQYISFANCGLPYYLGGVITERENLLVQTKEAMEARFNLEVRENTEVTRIHPERKEVEVLAGGTTYKESYDYLILAPGAAPVVPPIPGIRRDNICTLRNMADVDRIKDLIVKRQPRKAVVVGGGFVGIEMAENLRETGADVTLVEAAPQIMGPMDPEIAHILEEQLQENSIQVLTGDAVSEFAGDSQVEVVLAGGSRLPADLVILAIGVKPETRLAVEAGLAIGSRGGIQVNEYLQTSDPSIYAVGDAIEVKDLVTGVQTLIPLAGPANKQGRIAADNICGRQVKFNGAQGTSIIKVFDLTGAATGSNEKTLQRAGIPYLKSYTHTNSHAGYYPGAFTMTIKLLFSPDNGRVLGAQIVGRKGVDKRIDVLATAIRHNLTVYDLEELELAYAPPFSSAKDPVNIAGFTAANILKGDVKIKHWDELNGIAPNKYLLIDVRTDLEFAGGHPAQAVNIPLDSLRSRLAELPKDKDIYVYCKVGLRGYLACRLLEQHGFTAYNMSGGSSLLPEGEKIYDAETVSETDPSVETPVTGTNCTGQSGAQAAAQQCCPPQPCAPQPCAGERKTVIIDACGLQCPGPIMKVYQTMQNLNPGEVLEVHVTDPAFSKDIKAWCNRTGNALLETKKTTCDFVAYIQKGMAGSDPGKASAASSSGGCCPSSAAVPAMQPAAEAELPQGKTLVVFSGDLDKALASFIIANGAAAMGRPVTMFFTFWGLNILRREAAPPVKRTLTEKMLAFMMPSHSKQLGLSKMHMFGMGPKMIRWTMDKKKISSLEELIALAKTNGVKMVACSMSMDVMGIKEEELIDGVEMGGVAAYLGDAEQSNVNLFI